VILDQWPHLKRYTIPQTDRIIQFIAENNCLTLPNEQIDIDGKNLFVRVMEYQPKPAQENKFETHKLYADIQYVVQGVELMQIAPTSALTPLGTYDPTGDYEFFKAENDITDLVVRAGEFTYFYPGEAHRPACLYKSFNSTVKKLVFKIKIN
jgi:biofilm protein TabA